MSPKVKRIPALEYVRVRWPYFNRTLLKKRPSHILSTHCEDNGMMLCAFPPDNFTCLAHCPALVLFFVLARFAAHLISLPTTAAHDRCRGYPCVLLLTPHLLFRRAQSRESAFVHGQSPDVSVFEEFVQSTRRGPLLPGEDWLAALPPILANTIFLTLFGLHFGQSRIQSYSLDDNNRTDWRASCAFLPPHPACLHGRTPVGENG